MNTLQSLRVARVESNLVRLIAFFNYLSIFSSRNILPDTIDDRQVIEETKACLFLHLSFGRLPTPR